MCEVQPPGKENGAENLGAAGGSSGSNKTLLRGNLHLLRAPRSPSPPPLAFPELVLRPCWDPGESTGMENT